MFRLRTFFLLCIALSPLAACKTALGTQATVLEPTPTAVAAVTPELDWERRWLFGRPCALPCWENISPGTTTAEQALQTLQSNPLIRSARIVTSTLMPELGELNWTWFDGTYGGRALFNATADQNLIEVILPSAIKPLSWQAVLDNFGEPTGIMAIGDRGPDIDSPTLFAVIVLYQDDGFALSIIGRESPPVLSPMLSFDSVVFFDSTIVNLEALAPFINWRTTDVRTWDGFREYSFYCHDRWGQPCGLGE